ncbi:hypothetical protein BV898_10919 [Hypsibius exemplaris]|uniref:Fringe-like glycosyltransferase domain-containing protein n=1 Tax=Hypsibius exemplaris TaxID=2072580 RepID=A0A1W0WI78_HYPEX|nr:hypothetical protein BV898_10919 [Hypsibius exemplaris]
MTADGYPVVSAIHIVSDTHYPPSGYQNGPWESKSGKLSVIRSIVEKLWQRRSRTAQYYDATFCGQKHNGVSLTCKMQEELRLYYKTPPQMRSKWFCHFDDDVYVNIFNLIKALKQLGDPEKKALYVGKKAAFLPHGMNITYGLSSSEERWRSLVWAVGPAVCLSSRLMNMMQSVLEQDDHPANILAAARRLDETVGDDILVAIFITEHLRIPLTNVERMYSVFDKLNTLGTPDLEAAVVLTQSKENFFHLPDDKPVAFSPSGSLQTKFSGLHRHLKRTLPYLNNKC